MDETKTLSIIEVVNMGNYCNTTNPLFCKPCIYADIYNTYEYRAWGREANITNVFCKKKFKNVRTPSERCPERRLKPKCPIDGYAGNTPTGK